MTSILTFASFVTRAWRFTRKPEWLKDFSPTEKASQAEARDGLLAVVKPIRAIPAPKKFYEETKVACMQTDNKNKI